MNPRENYEGVHQHLHPLNFSRINSKAKSKFEFKLGGDKCTHV